MPALVGTPDERVVRLGWRVYDSAWTRDTGSTSPTSQRVAFDNVSVIYSTMPRLASSSDPFLAVADPTRRAILDRLRAGETPFAELAAEFPISAPAVSRHLRVLREARLVQERRDANDARQRSYRLDPQPLREVVDWARGYQQYWEGNLASLKRHVEARKTKRT